MKIKTDPFMDFNYLNLIDRIAGVVELRLKAGAEIISISVSYDVAYETYRGTIFYKESE